MNDDDARAYEPGTPGRRFTVALTLAVAGVAVLAAGLVALRYVRTRQEAEARVADARTGRRVLVVQVDRTPGRITLRLPGAIRGYTETPVYAKIAGYLRSIAVDKGDRVKAGDLLAVLESPELDQQVGNARASYDLKRATDARFETLRRSGVVSTQESDQARADLLQAEATLRQLRAMQGYERITADADAVVTARYADPGALVPQATAAGSGASTPIVALATIDRVRVLVDLPERSAPFVRDGDPAEVTVGQYPGRRFSGTVTRHPQAIAAATRTMLVEVDLQNDDAALLPGMSADVSIEVTGRATVPRVPDDVLIFRDGRTWVPVVENDRLHLVPITLGYDDGRTTEVTDGLAGGEWIATNAGQTARDGETVRAQPRS